MAHTSQQKYCEDIKNKFPEFFKDIKVLDIGSLDVNGSNRYLFENCNYIGLDVAEGKNVDVVSVAHEYDSENESFDVVMSTNAFEHDIHYKLTLNKMVELLRPGGLMFFSASNSFKKHGTKDHSPSSSNTSTMDEKWANYYKNLNLDDVESVLNLDDIFEKYKLDIYMKDIRFWGIKRYGC